MSRWWRAYDEAIDDPKLCLLSDRAHRAWFNLCCLTSASGGTLPDMRVIALKLRMPAGKAAAIVAELKEAGLIDEDETGSRPHNWNGRQFKSDVSTDRVKRFRQQQRNVSVTPPETEEQNTEAERKKDIRAVAVATRTIAFDEFWKVYPKREGASGKADAQKRFLAAVKSGIDPENIISAAKLAADEARANNTFGTPYVPMASTWLNKKRWNDYQRPAVETTGPPQPPNPSMPSDAELRAKYAKRDPVPSATTTARPADRTGADHPPELLPASDRGCADQPSDRRGPADNQPRVAGMRSLGSLLPRLPAMAAVGAASDAQRANPVDDGPDAMA